MLSITSAVCSLKCSAFETKSSLAALIGAAIIFATAMPSAAATLTFAGTSTTSSEAYQFLNNGNGLAAGKMLATRPTTNIPLTFQFTPAATAFGLTGAQVDTYAAKLTITNSFVPAGTIGNAYLLGGVEVRQPIGSTIFTYTFTGPSKHGVTTGSTLLKVTMLDYLLTGDAGGSTLNIGATNGANVLFNGGTATTTVAFSSPYLMFAPTDIGNDAFSFTGTSKPVSILNKYLGPTQFDGQGSFAATPVPEQGTIALLSSLACVGFVARRRCLATRGTRGHTKDEGSGPYGPEPSFHFGATMFCFA